MIIKEVTSQRQNQTATVLSTGLKCLWPVVSGAALLLLCVRWVRGGKS
jgi:hypothetical protein